MRITVASALVPAVVLALTPAVTDVASGADKVEQALREVRDVKADLRSRRSTVLGKLPGPEESAAHQMRCRPIPGPGAGVSREMRFDEQTTQRAAKLNPTAMRKQKGRMGRRVLPLGITGAYVCEFLKRKELLVVHVLDGCPAAGVLEVDDIILGANGRLFEDPEDPRPEMGNALAENQSPELGGILTLQVARGRKPLNVTLDLGSELPYSDTWPMECLKAREIRRAALEYVIRSHPWDRRDFWTPLFLMASGGDAALELARRHICAKLKDEYEPGRGGRTWSQSYDLINLCEYYLLTGDAAVSPAKTKMDKQVAAKRAELAAATHRHHKARRQAELDALLFAAARFDELAELASVIDALGAVEPSAADVQTLCRFYVKRPWGREYLFTRSESSYVRAFDETQLALIRDTLPRWGSSALPALKAFLEADSRDLAAAIAKLDEDQKHWEPQRARLRGLPLARIGREREDIRSIRTELRDLAAVIEYRLADRLSAEQVGRLCRVYTHRSWPAQNRWIAEILKDAGPGAAPTIRDHIKRTARELPELQAVIELAMPKVSSTPTRWRYERAVALRGNIRRGIKGLEGVVEGMRK